MLHTELTASHGRDFMPFQSSIAHVLQNDLGITYKLDAWGNMTQKNQLSGYAANPDAMSNSANVTNQLTSQVAYDAAGNMTSFYNGIANIYPVFDAENRMVSAGS